MAQTDLKRRLAEEMSIALQKGLSAFMTENSVDMETALEAARLGVLEIRMELRPGFQVWLKPHVIDGKLAFEPVPMEPLPDLPFGLNRVTPPETMAH